MEFLIKQDFLKKSRSVMMRRMRHHIKNIFRLWSILKPFHAHFYFQLIIILISQLFIVAFAYLNGQLLNNLVSKNTTGIIFFFSFWVGAVLLDLFVEYVRDVNKDRELDQKIFSHLQEFSMKKLLGLTIAQHVEDHSALKLAIIQKGETATQNIIDRIITIILPAVTLVLLSLITIAWYNITIAFISAIAMFMIFTFSYIVNKKRRPLIVRNRDNWNEQQKIRTEAFTHLQLVKSLHREETFLEKYMQKRLAIVQQHIELRVGGTRIGSMRSGLTEISSFITLGLAAYFFVEGMFSVGIIYLIWNLTNRVYWQISSLSNTMREIPILYADAEKYFHIIDMEPSFKESGKKNVSFKEDIIVSHVSFTYPRGDRNVLEDISFTIPSGKKVAIVGSSGSGKSTLTKLFLRAYDYEKGSIRIGTTELKNIDAGYLREHIGYVEQYVELFDDTIKENILIGVTAKKRIKAEKELEIIARKARIDQFYHRLGEKKFDTLVGERGIKLSGGERQRVGIARAIIKDPEILIFDEATSSLDTGNEKYVMEAIKEVSKGKTTIIIAHRLSTVKDADKIIVMDKGKIVSEGTHEELLQSSLVYTDLVQHQMTA